MNKSFYKFTTFALLAILLVSALVISSFASATGFEGRLFGDISGNGKIDSSDARTFLRIAAKLDTLENHMNTTPVDANITLGWDIIDVPDSSGSEKVIGGEFIIGESAAAIRATASENVENAVLRVVDSSEKVVFEAPSVALKKHETATVVWDGKTADGFYAETGEYTVVLICGQHEETLTGLFFYAEKTFTKGNGSETKPFEIDTTEDFANVGVYAKAYFKQTNNLDFKNKTVKGMFAGADKPFNGVYDGNGKIISNMKAEDALFGNVAENGVIKALTFKNCTFAGDGGVTRINNGLLDSVTVEESSFTGFGGLAYENSGEIRSCKISANLSKENTKGSSSFGLVTAVNKNLIEKCDASGDVSGIATFNGTFVCYVGGITGTNEGRILSCKYNSGRITAHLNPGVFTPAVYAGGIAGINTATGIIKDSDAAGEVIASRKTNTTENKDMTQEKDLQGLFAGGIAGSNKGQIDDRCDYTGGSKILHWNSEK